MPKTYSNRSNIERIREPLLQINRVKYRDIRRSQYENLETNLLRIDLSRIQNELNSIDESILDKLVYFLGDINDIDESVLLNDGLSYSLNDLQFYYDDKEETYAFSLDVMNKLSGKLTRLFNKVQRLEKRQ